MGFAGEITGVSSTFGLALGLNDGSANFWANYLDAGTANYAGYGAAGAGTTDTFHAHSAGPTMFFGLSIEELGIATGTRTIQPIVADGNDTNSHTIDGSSGTVKPAQIYMAIWDFT